MSLITGIYKRYIEGEVRNTGLTSFDDGHKFVMILWEGLSRGQETSGYDLERNCNPVRNYPCRGVSLQRWRRRYLQVDCSAHSSLWRRR